MDPHNGSVTTLIRSAEAAPSSTSRSPTLYAYVSRGRLQRTTAPDGRTSLFARDEVERLAERSRRAAPGQRATIDVQIASAVTVIDDSDLRYRGVRVDRSRRNSRFEDVAELLWTGSLSGEPNGVRWPALSTDDRDAIRPIADLTRHTDRPDRDRRARPRSVTSRRLPRRRRASATRSRRQPSSAPRVAPDASQTAWLACGALARHLNSSTPSTPRSILLADHELATSTLAVRIAASVRTSPYVAFAAGLASMEGTLHGSASAEVHRFLIECAGRTPQP